MRLVTFSAIIAALAVITIVFIVRAAFVMLIS
jgi:hypothetical protein